MNAKRLFVVLSLTVLVAASATVAVARPGDSDRGGPSRYDVALIGDFPYNALQEEQAARMFAELDGERLAFIAHDGDIKSGSSACTDDVYQKELRRFEASRNPLVYTPGDNEWTDCHRPPNPTPEEADPLNRLEYLRGVFFPEDDSSLGKREIDLVRQSEEYPENARWHFGPRRGGVTYATLHVVGSNDNRPTAANPAVGNEAEWRARTDANLAWLSETFDEAQRRRSAAVMLVIQANPFEEDTSTPSGFTEFKQALERETIAFGKPVVLVHGDSHTFRIDKPVISEERPLNFTRVETFGSPDVHWVRARVDTRDEEVFSFEPELIEENVAP